MNADISRLGFITIKWHVLQWKMKHLEMSHFYLSTINVSLHFFAACIITDTIASHLHVIEDGTIHQHVLKH